MTNNCFFPDIAIPPGESLKDVLEEQDMTQAELASRMGRPTKTISEIINGKAKITADTAIQLETVLGIPAQFWINLQAKYDEDLARVREKEELAVNLEWLRNFPIKEMIKNGWIMQMDSKEAQLKEVFAYFSIANRDVWNGLWMPKLLNSFAFRKSAKFETSDYSLAAWARQGEKLASTVECLPFDKRLLAKSIPEIRKLTKEHPDVFLRRLQEIGRNCGVVFLLVKEVPKLPVFAVTYWPSVNKAVVQLTIRQKTDDHFWFSVFHELGHILTQGKRDFYFEDDVWEGEADEFAQKKLIPPDEYSVFVSRGRFSANDVKYFADLIGVAPGIVVGRLQHEKRIGYHELNALKIKFEWA